jgi:hypothetical protein
VNSISAQTIFDTNKYDSIYFQTENFIVATQNDTVKLINTKGDFFYLNNFIAIAEIQPNVAYQIVLGDKLKMINGEGRFDKSIKISFSRRVCGTVNRYKNSILIRNDSTFIQFHTTYPWYKTDSKYEDKLAETNDTIFVDKGLSLYFLNNDRNFDYKESDFFAEGLGENLFLEKNNHKTNILSIEKNDSTLLKKYLVKHIDSIYKNKDIIPYATFQPFIFKIGKLFGYFPFQLKPKYTTIKAFDKKFAAFVLPNGQKGWLDINGKEYLFK